MLASCVGRGMHDSHTPHTLRQWGMKKKEQKKDGAVRPEDVPGGAFYFIIGCGWSDGMERLVHSNTHDSLIRGSPPQLDMRERKQG